MATFTLGRIVVDTSECLISTSAGRVRIKEPVARLLEHLAAAEGQVVTRETLLNQLWRGRDVDEKNLVMLVGRARQILGQFLAGPCPLITVHGKGYQLLGCVRGPDNAPPTATETTRLHEVHRGRLSIAIQPLRHARQGQLEYVAESICDSLAIRLSACCRVIPAVPVARSDDLYERIDTAAEHGAVVPDFILTGSVYENGEKLRVNVHLVDPGTSELVWGVQTVTSRRDQFEMEEDLGDKVFAHLSGLVKGIGGDQQFSATWRTTFHSYVLGRHFMARRSSQGMQRARGLFESALTENSSFSPGLAELACCMALSPYYFERDSRSAAASAIETAKLTLKLDPACAAAYSVLGLAHLTLRSRAAARAAFEKAIELGSDDTRAYRFFADYHVWNGDMPRAIFCARRSVDLDPASPVANSDCAQTLFYARHFDEALQYTERALQLDSEFANAHYMAAQVLRQLGLGDKASEAAERACSLAPESDLFRLVASALGASQANSRKSQVTAKKPATTEYGHALFHAWRGDVDASLAYLQRCVDEYAPFSLFIGADANFDGVRGHMQFDALVARIRQDQLSLA